ncbi:FeoC-like transcriptional regulator [Aliiroseovarius crassostreae]|uniref:FeoC-like transcriptional regulator n=1 Tax=Aliiroseovarius crassostreae TaxID=154981 RepID=A0A9Q9H7M9_9RHOB|nr:FeoC-like transcriptional regulator [Aliiroseovarius crassostreae]UWP90988.1 FeoC-like transcriptional regulator [Aliiroseovarius crassostreae]UWP94176.1 FeoC-like transcriptional regulator [Aliiroseovarius crassostreae]UWQ00455.1 FeoC-like transcriptional regulator [Aliiroseovarius crassostreae]
MLLDLRSYVKSRQSVSLLEISNHFRRPPDAVRGMLAHWVAKGVIRRQNLRATCGSCASSRDCGGCDVTDSLEIYDWVG